MVSIDAAPIVVVVEVVSDAKGEVPPIAPLNVIGIVNNVGPAPPEKFNVPGEMPVTVGVFINPGQRGDPAASGQNPGARSNRSLEYDGLGDAYARFLIDELLPFVVGKYHVNLSADPRMRALAGMSSGGICAFTAAWERPDQFGKVLSQIGSL